MANRLIPLNETSYHGKGAIQNIVHLAFNSQPEFQKALVVTDKDLIKFNVAQKVTALLDAAGLPYEIFDEVSQPGSRCDQSGGRKIQSLQCRLFNCDWWRLTD